MDGLPGTRPSKDGTSLGARLRRAREAAGLTQEELAARAGLSTNSVSALERGQHHHPYPATVRALAAALELTAEERAGLIAAMPTRGDRAVEAGGRLPALPVPPTPLI